MRIRVRVYLATFVFWLAYFWADRVLFLAYHWTRAAELPLGAEPGPNASMRVHVIDVGQGAATLVEFSCGAVLVDTGVHLLSRLSPGRIGVGQVQDLLGLAQLADLARVP